MKRIGLIFSLFIVLMCSGCGPILEPLIEGTYTSYKEEKNVELIEKLDQLSLINTNGMVVVESLAQQTFPEQIATLSKQKEKVYGITKITYYRKQEQQ